MTFLLRMSVWCCDVIPSKRLWGWGYGSGSSRPNSAVRNTGEQAIQDEQMGT